MPVEFNKKNVKEKKMRSKSEKKQKAQHYLKLIRIQFFILFGTGLIAGIMFSAFRGSSKHDLVLIGEWVYIVYELGIRVITTILGFYYLFKYYNLTKQNLSSFQKWSYLNLSLSSIIFLIIIPLITGFADSYYAFMPFPWLSAPFQVIARGMVLNIDITSGVNPVPNAVQLFLLLYSIFQVISFLGVFILGRRWQCSMLCVMAGGHAEAFGKVLPIFPHNKKKPFSKQIYPLIRKLLIIFQIYQFSLQIFISFAWIFILNDISLGISSTTLVKIETVNYYIFGLVLMTLGWIFIGGRAYCLYCPAGTLIGLCGRMIGQKIETGLTKCISCGLCNSACKMSIDIKSYAEKDAPMKSINCVGCGACVSVCPTKNLRYSTIPLQFIRNKLEKDKVVGNDDVES